MRGMLLPPLEESASTARPLKARKLIGIGLLGLLLAAGLAACGGSRQDENEPSGDFPVQIVSVPTGQATILRGDAVKPVVAAIHERYLTADARADPRVGGALSAVDDVVIAIRPTTWRAWASAEMDQQFFGGLLSANRAKWFRKLD